MALKLWEKFLSGRKIVINCDNSVSCSVLNRGVSRDAVLQFCLREICFFFFVAAVHEFQVRAVWIQGIENRIPDFLSRWDLSLTFRKLFFQHVGNQSIHEYKVDDSLFEFSHDW